MLNFNIHKFLYHLTEPFTGWQKFFFIKKKNKVPLLILISCKHKQHCLDSSKGLGLRPPHTVTVSIDIKPAL